MEGMQKKLRDLEKSNTSLRKSAAESAARAEVSDREAKVVKEELASIQATLKFEKETSELEISSLKEAVSSLEKKAEGLTDQLEDIAIEAMLKARSDLMKQYLAGEQHSWTPQEWIEQHKKWVADSEPAGGGEVEQELTTGLEPQPGAVEEAGQSSKAQDVVDSPARVD